MEEEPEVSTNSGLDEQIKELLKEYIDLTKTIDKVNTDLKTAKKRREKLEEVLHVYMASNEINRINVPEMSFQIYKSKTAKPINRNFIETKLAEVVGSDQAATLVEHLYTNREYNEKEIVKKTKKK